MLSEEDRKEFNKYAGNDWTKRKVFGRETRLFIFKLAPCFALAYWIYTWWEAGVIPSRKGNPPVHYIHEPDMFLLYFCSASSALVLLVLYLALNYFAALRTHCLK
jgi:hypothetical protein